MIFMGSPKFGKLASLVLGPINKHMFKDLSSYPWPYRSETRISFSNVILGTKFSIGNVKIKLEIFLKLGGWWA